MKTAEQFITFGQGNVEAMVKSSQIVASGLQDLSKQMAANAQAAMDEEPLDVPRAWPAFVPSRRRSTFRRISRAPASRRSVAQTGQMTGASFKLAEQACEPARGTRHPGGRELQGLI